MTTKQKILFISTRPPYPLLSGEKNKTFNEIKILSKKYDLIYCSLCPASDMGEVRKLLTPYCHEVHLVKSSKLASLAGALASLLTGKPLQVGYFFSTKLKSIVEKKITEVDAVFVNLFRAVQYLPSTTKPSYLDMSDSISEHYKKAVSVTTNFLWKFIFFFEGQRMRKYEDLHLKKFDKVFLFNPEEIKLYNAENLKWIPHGVNQKVLDYKIQMTPSNSKITFLGKMDYRPNVEAVKWFVAEVLPFLDKKFSFQIIGAFPSKEVLELNKIPRVEVTGFVDDPYKLLLESHCVVAPMVSGGGIQNKLLESMAIGCPNIVTSICARPLKDLKEEVLITDDPEKMATLISNLGEKQRQELGERAKEYIQKNYTWEKYEEVLYREVKF